MKVGRRLVGLLRHTINGLWAIPAVFVLRILRPWILIRLGPIRADRIGHFTIDSCEQLARRKENKGAEINWFWLPRETSNSQWSIMVRREMPIYDWTCSVDFWNRKIIGGGLNTRPSSHTSSRDVEGLFARYDARLAFTETETQSGKEWLGSIGVGEKDKFVCVLVRDSKFLSRSANPSKESELKQKWAYHDYRNSDITTYVPALEWLADQGVTILRMGSLVEKPMLTNHPRLVDYAFRSDRSAFLDIWLFANCSFCISTSTGLDQLTNVYRRPILYLNASPLGHFTSYNDCVWTPKNLTWRRSGKCLNLTEYLEHTFFSSKKFADSGIELTDLTSVEIFEGVEEFWNRKHGIWEKSEDDKARHDAFWKILENWEDYEQFHGWRHPHADVSTTWLRRQSSEFFN